MSEQITTEVFEHLVRLAALELESQEAEYLRSQLNNQLRAIQELEAIPLESGTALSSHGVSYTPASAPPARADEPLPAPDSEKAQKAEKILAQAPEFEDGYIIVPEIPHTEL